MDSDSAREIIVTGAGKTVSAVYLLRPLEVTIVVRVFAGEEIHVMKPVIRETYGTRRSGVDRHVLVEAHRNPPIDRKDALS